MTADRIPAPICRCSGEEHLDTRDALNASVRTLEGLRTIALARHSLTSAEERAFVRLAALLDERARELHHHAYAVHGVERMTK